VYRRLSSLPEASSVDMMKIDSPQVASRSIILIIATGFSKNSTYSTWLAMVQASSLIAQGDAMGKLGMPCVALIFLGVSFKVHKKGI
jgi:hypothetical protein